MNAMTTQQQPITAAGYVRCLDSDVPAGIRWDTPRRNQGQMVEISYGTFGRAEAGPGDPFMRRVDHTGETGEMPTIHKWTPAQIPAWLQTAADKLSKKHGKKVVGLEWADYLEFDRAIKAGADLFLALAWVQAGKPEIRQR